MTCGGRRGGGGNGGGRGGGGGGGGGFFLACEHFGETVGPVIPRLRFVFVF